MTKDQERPDVAEILRTLKDFQRRTVDYVFRRLYIDGDCDRFLIADEVGLGKTLVAKGVVARAVEQLWDKRTRLNIVYICANSAIARQNVNRLNITGTRETAIADRMTLLPAYLQDLRENKINFVSFTPGTSFDFGQQTGVARERAMLYHILQEAWGFGNASGPKNLLQGNMGRENWRWVLQEPEETCSRLRTQYIKALATHPEIRRRFEELAERFHYARTHVPEQDRLDRNALIGSLRRLLAETCVNALEPDIVILDEFQRFRTLLDVDDEENEAAQLARAVFEYPKAKVLLLSATPYKMYTMYHEQEAEDDHYSDFIFTVGFLLNNKAKTCQFEQDLARYRRALLQAETGIHGALMEAKCTIERTLRSVMVRTERVEATSDRDSMIQDVPVPCALAPADVNCFAALDGIARHLNVGDTVEYWKSAPYLLNVMEHDGYKIKSEFLARTTVDGENPELSRLCDLAREGLLSWNTINGYRPCDPANAKLRTVLGRKVHQGAWQLLWVPPSLPYYRPAAGPYARDDLGDFTKALIFSSWAVVPKVVAMLCSYEAERRMVTAFSTAAQYGTEDRRRRRPLLVFAVSQGRFTGMRNFCLVYPCSTLATHIDPMELGARLSRVGTLPDEKNLVNAAETKIRELLRPVLAKHGGVSSGPEDENWYWAALALLDYEYYPKARKWLARENEENCWSSLMEGASEDTDSRFADHAEGFLMVMAGNASLGRPPQDLVEVLAKIALASPAVTSLRAMMRVLAHPRPSRSLVDAAATVGMAFRSLFNIPEAVAMIRSLREGDDASYWQSVLDYCLGGNLQAVMDEYTHVLRESLGVFSDSADSAALQIGREAASALSLRTASLEFDEIMTLDNRVRVATRKMRCRFALQFTDVRSEDGKVETRREQVRIAFNSPFQPFVLATTSIGQEGLDFHQYCHEVYHWNLPPNPIDLEQREGRIHRYKGHVIRRNVAAEFGLQALSGDARELSDPWCLLFALAKASRPGHTDLVPYWIFEPSGGGHKVLRYIPALPLSREVAHLESLRRTIVAYRMVLGQPRQEDLVNYLSHRLGRGVEPEELLRYRIDLSPTI